MIILLPEELDFYIISMYRTTYTRRTINTGKLIVEVFVEIGNVFVLTIKKSWGFLYVRRSKFPDNISARNTAMHIAIICYPDTVIATSKIMIISRTCRQICCYCRLLQIKKIALSNLLKYMCIRRAVLFSANVINHYDVTTSLKCEPKAYVC